MKNLNIKKSKMKKRFFSPILFVATALFFTGCKVTEVVEFDQDIDVTIQGVTYDADGNTLLSEVSVSLLGDEAITTGEDGVYQFQGKETGSHLVRFEKEGFATMVQTILVEGTELTAEEVTNSSVIEMFHVNEALTTTFKLSNGEETSVVENLPVTIELNSTGDAYFENDKIETTTDADGVLSLAGLPDVVLTVTAELVDGSDIYTKTFNTTASNVAESYTFTDSDKVSTLQAFLLVDSNIIDDEDATEVTDFDPTGNITFEFSDVINVDYEDYEVTLFKGFDEIVVDLTVAGNLLTIDPRGATLEAGASYTVNVEVQSLEADAGTYDESFTFTVAGEELTLTQVIDLSLDEEHNANTLPTGTEIKESQVTFRIQFNEVVDADRYEVFGLYSAGTNEYIRLSAALLGNDSDNNIEYLVTLEESVIGEAAGEDGFFDGGELTIIVRAANGFGDAAVYGEFSDEFVIREGSDTTSSGN